MRNYCFLIMLISGLLTTPVQAEMADMKWFADQAALINSKANWKLFSRDTERNIEFYYDEKNIVAASKESKIVQLKKVYKSQRAITELVREREREQNMRSSGSKSSTMQYGEFAFSIETAEVFCSSAKIGVENIAYDFDKDGNVLNIVPMISTVVPILSNSAGERLYNILCAMEKGEQRDIKNVNLNTVASSNATGSYSYKDPFTDMEFIFVKGGCFERNDMLNDSPANQGPVHEVCVDDYYIGKYEVTQDQWKRVVGSDPIHSVQCSGNCPSVFISWNMAEEFIQKLNDQAHMNYRLPSEAEWEYAARNRGANQKYAGTNSESELANYAWYDANSLGQIHPVGQKKPNELGICDMSGNVWEWVGDWYEVSYNKNSPKNNPTGPSTGKQRVKRGGNYQCSEDGIRTTNRVGVKPGMRDNGTGFRLVLCVDSVKNESIGKK